jgi:hypothetical protein
MVHAGQAAAKSIAIFNKVADIALQLTFKESPNCPTWCLSNERVTNLANKIAICNEWDPATLHSLAQPLTPVPKLDTSNQSLLQWLQPPPFLSLSPPP